MALQAPANYSLNLPDPLQAFQQGQAWRDQQMQRQASQQRAQEIQQAIGSLPARPSISQINDLIYKFPELEERFKKQLGDLSEQDKQAKLSEAIPIFAALANSKFETAEQLFRNKATALRNSGDEQGAKRAEMQADLVKNDPDTAYTSNGAMLAGIMGPQAFEQTFGKLEDVRKAALLTPLEIKKKEQELKRDLEAGGFENHSVRIYPNGVSRAVGKDGTIQVRSPSGKLLENEASANAALVASS